MTFIYRCILAPNGLCNVTMNLFTICYWQIAWRGTNFYDCASRQAPGCCRCCRASASRPPLCGWWPRRPGEGVWTCSRFRAGKRIKSGYLGWWNLFLARTLSGGHLQSYRGGECEGGRGQGPQGVPPDLRPKRVRRHHESSS